MTLIELQQQLRLALKEKYGVDEAMALTKLLLEDVLLIDRKSLLLNPEQSISEADTCKAAESVERLLRSEPIQYISNRAHFLSHIYYVDSSVLIPRQETEELVMHVVRNNQLKAPVVVDLCTGSGCIAISLQLLIPDAVVHAVDVSKAALDVARRNAANLLQEDQLHIHEADVLVEDPFQSMGKVDIIVSNPPYVMMREKELMLPNVLEYEPHLALFVSDDDALVFYRRIAEQAYIHLNAGGYLYFEINEQAGESLARLLIEKGFTAVKLLADINGKNRMVVCQKLANS